MENNLKNNVEKGTLEIENEYIVPNSEIIENEFNTLKQNIVIHY